MHDINCTQDNYEEKENCIHIKFVNGMIMLQASLVGMAILMHCVIVFVIKSADIKYFPLNQ